MIHHCVIYVNLFFIIKRKNWLKKSSREAKVYIASSGVYVIIYLACRVYPVTL